MKCTLSFDGRTLTGPADQPLIDFLAAQGIDLPHVCYHEALGPLQTCDVCWVEVSGELVRGCTLHNTFADMEIPIQRYPFRRKPFAKDHSSPFYTYDPDQCMRTLCGSVSERRGQ